jgi:hypothetical protein
MAYREIVDSLAARLELLEAQVDERTRERDEVAAMHAEAQARARDEEYVAAAPVRARRRRLMIASAVASVVMATIGVLVVAHVTSRKPDQLERAIQGMESYADQLCACTDASCTRQVTGELMNWVKQFPPGYDPRPMPPIIEARSAVAAARMSACMQRELLAPAPPPEPQPMPVTVAPVAPVAPR